MKHKRNLTINIPPLDEDDFFEPYEPSNCVYLMDKVMTLAILCVFASYVMFCIIGGMVVLFILLF